MTRWGAPRAVVAAAIASAVVLANRSGRASDAPSFRRDVLPVLSRAGCNGGGCHGALAGKGGFRLSLFGYDPRADHVSITRDARGRRIELGDPGRSLVLLKPTMALPHKGGLRLEPGSDDYRTIARWIAAGAPPPRDDDPELVSLSVEPAAAKLSPGEGTALVVRAHYDDGEVRDVTRWARFTSTDQTVATVDENGAISVIGSGEGAVTAWFSSRIVIARVTVPFPHEVPASVFAEAPRSNFIDELVLEQLERLSLRPSPPADDATLVRRAFLDTIGRLPSPAEVREYLEDESPTKYEALVDRLLTRDEYVDYWTYKLCDILLVTSEKLRPDAVKSYYSWIRDRVADDVPWNELVRRIVTAKGSSIENGATNFYAVHQDPESMAENVSQAFLSLSINCARCHNHPLEKWTNDQYYAFANLFARVRAKGWGGDPRNGDGRRTVYVEPRGDLIQPRTGKPLPPAPLDAPPIAPDDPGDRREVLADWLTSPENPYFTRAIANRLWASYLGVGLVEPVDDLRFSNPPSNEALLAALADAVVANDYDLRRVSRLILTSQTYRRSSASTPQNAGDERNFSRYYPRRLMSEVLADAIGDVTGVRDRYTAIANKDGSTTQTSFYPPGTRAIELFDSAVESRFLDSFGRNERQITCECERSNQPSLVQALHLSNGSTLNDKLADPESRVTNLLARDVSIDGIIDEAWLLCLSRFPTEAEREQVRAVLAEAEDADRRVVVEDLFWSLLTSREFLFQH